MKTAICRLAALKAKSFVYGKVPFPKEARVDRRHAYRSCVSGSDLPADRGASPERNSAGVAFGRHAVSRFAGDRARAGLFTNGDSDGVGFALCRGLPGIDTARWCYRCVGQAGAGEPGACGVRLGGCFNGYRDWPRLQSLAVPSGIRIRHQLEVRIQPWWAGRIQLCVQGMGEAAAAGLAESPEFLLSGSSARGASPVSERNRPT